MKNLPFREISASWRCLEFQPIPGAAALQCVTVCYFANFRQASGEFNENVLKSFLLKTKW